MTPESNTSRKTLPRDEFGRGESYHWIVLAAVPLIVVLLAVFLRNTGDIERRVVVYCAQDMTYAEPILKAFEKSSGLKVATVYDSEAVKTAGLANRLLAERNSPRCDVFWGNEEMRTRQLAASGVFRETNGWSSFGYRSRRIVVNTNKLALADAPRSLLELTNAQWRGKVALAFPQFGTTATHFHALRQHWGDELWRAWCQGLAANEPFLMEGNSSVVKIVARGLAVIGLTDSDDIAAAQAEGGAVAAQPMAEETLLIPNTVGLVRKSPISPGAEALCKYLQQPGTIEILVSRHALEGTNAASVRTKTLQVDWKALLADLDATSGELSRFFLK